MLAKENPARKHMLRIELCYEIYKIYNFRDSLAKTAKFANLTVFRDDLAKTTKLKD